MLLASSCHSSKRISAGASHTGNVLTKQEKTSPVAVPPVPPQRFNVLFLEAERQKCAGHTDAQYELLTEALRLCPQAPEALYEMGVLLTTQTAYSDTLSRQRGDSLLHEAVRLEPTNTDYKNMLATHLANNARYTEAIALYEDMADEQPSSETLSLLVWLYKTSGDYAGAIRTLDRIEQMEGHSEEVSMEKFQTYLAMNDAEHAYQAIEDLCAEYPFDLRYRVLLGDLYNEQGYHEQALYTYRDVLTAEPNNSYAQLSLLAYYKAAGADSLYLDLLHRVVRSPGTQSGARAQAMQGYMLDNINTGADPAPVQALFKELLHSPQETADLAGLWLMFMTRRGYSDDSLMVALHTIVSIEPSNTKARLLLVQQAMQGKTYDEAIKLCREGQLYDPSELRFYLFEGMSHFIKGNNQAAAKVLQKGAERIDENTADTQVASDLCATLGDVLHEQGNDVEAFLSYDQALKWNPMNLLCLNNYAYFLTLRGEQLDKALRMSELTIEAEPQNPTYLDTWAWALYRKGRYAEAQAAIDSAMCHTAPGDEAASLFDHAGDIACRLRQKAKAVTYWRRALRLETEPKNRRRLQRKIATRGRYGQ